MSTGNRRAFLKAGTSAFTAAGLATRRVSAQTGSPFNRIKYRALGSTGFMTSEIGFGCMNMRDPELVYAAIDSGVNYLDTANSYMNGVNEEVVGGVMRTKRDKVFLTTKIKWENPDRIPQMIEDSLGRLQTDHVDLLLLHVVDTREDALNDDLIQLFVDARRRGQTRFIGLSTHFNQAEVIDAAVESGTWEAVLTGYNYNSPPELSAAIKRAREAGLATIGMKNLITTEQPRGPFPDIRGGNEAITNQQALLRWVLEDRYIDTTIPGFTTFEQLADDIEVMSLKLAFDENRALRRYALDSRQQYCCGVSGCTGCRDQCPNGVQVGEINRCINYATGYDDPALARQNYDALPSAGKLDNCADCDECQVACINGLDLTERIRQARSLFT